MMKPSWQCVISSHLKCVVENGRQPSSSVTAGEKGMSQCIVILFIDQIGTWNHNHIHTVTTTEKIESLYCLNDRLKYSLHTHTHTNTHRPPLHKLTHTSSIASLFYTLFLNTHSLYYIHIHTHTHTNAHRHTQSYNTVTHFRTNTEQLSTHTWSYTLSVRHILYITHSRRQ